MPSTSIALARVAGLTCIAIGTAHMALGMRAEPGGDDVPPTTDSLDRFHGAVFAWYGATWLGAARGKGDAPAMQRLAAVMALGGAARLLTLSQNGNPHWFQHVLTGVEFGFPAAVFATTRRR